MKVMNKMFRSWPRCLIHLGRHCDPMICVQKFVPVICITPFWTPGHIALIPYDVPKHRTVISLHYSTVVGGICALVDKWFLRLLVNSYLVYLTRTFQVCIIFRKNVTYVGFAPTIPTSSQTFSSYKLTESTPKFFKTSSHHNLQQFTKVYMPSKDSFQSKAIANLTCNQIQNPDKEHHLQNFDRENVIVPQENDPSQQKEQSSPEQIRSQTIERSESLPVLEQTCALTPLHPVHHIQAYDMVKRFESDENTTNNDRVASISACAGAAETDRNTPYSLTSAGSSEFPNAAESSRKTANDSTVAGTSDHLKVAESGRKTANDSTVSGTSDHLKVAETDRNAANDSTVAGTSDHQKVAESGRKIANDGTVAGTSDHLKVAETDRNAANDGRIASILGCPEESSDDYSAGISTCFDEMDLVRSCSNDNCIASKSACLHTEKSVRNTTIEGRITNVSECLHETELNRSPGNDARLSSISESPDDVEWNRNTTNDRLTSISKCLDEPVNDKNTTNESRTVGISERRDDCSTELSKCVRSHDLKTPVDISQDPVPVKYTIQFPSPGKSTGKAKAQEKLTLVYFEQSLMLSHALVAQDQNVQLTKTKDERSLNQGVLKHEENGHNTSIKKLLSAPTIHFYRPAVENVFMFQDSDQSVFREEMRRLSSFHLCDVPEGIWVIRLAKAGFYLSDRERSIVRCAFCDVTVKMRSFRNRNALELHRTSPRCPVLTGEDGNIAVQLLGQASGRSFIKTMHRWTGNGNRDTLSSITSYETLAQSGQQSTAGHEGGNHRTVSSAFGTGSSQPQSSTSVSSEQSIPPSLLESQFDFGLGDASVSQATLNTSAYVPTVQSPVRSSSSPQSSGSSLRLQSVAEQTNTAPTVPSTAQGPAPSVQTTASRQSPPLSSLASAQQAPQGLPFQTARPINEQEASVSSSGQTGNNQMASAANTAAFSSPSQSGPSSEQQETVVTYQQLGIYTQIPKRPDLAVTTTRIRTFTDWPHSSTHSPEEMAEAGFYFVGQNDLVRCFYCKGGLKSWDRPLRPWVEHARFYPNCPYVAQVKGQEFVDVVQDLKRRQERISVTEVQEELQRRLHNRDQDPSGEEEVSAQFIEDHMGGLDDSSHDTMDINQLSLEADQLELENQEMSNILLCKVCQLNPLNILFLPCGHLCVCAQCSPALSTCAICRGRVKGRVRVTSVKGPRQDS